MEDDGRRRDYPQPDVDKKTRADDETVYKIVNAIPDEVQVREGMDVAVVLVAMAPVKIPFEDEEHDEAEQHNEEDVVAFAVLERLRYEMEKSGADQRTGGEADHKNQYPVHEPFVQQQTEDAY